MLRVNGMGRALRAAMTAATAAVAAWVVSAPVWAADQYPVRPVRMILGSAAGSGSDVVARVISAKLSQHLGHQVVVDNRPGASGLIAAEIVTKATPDGYTIWLPTLTQHLGTTLRNKFILQNEFEPVGLVATTPFLLVTNSSVPAKNTAEFIAYAKKNPGKLLHGSSGTAGSLHICVEVFQNMAGLKMVHVPYKGSAAAITDLIAGTIQLACPPVAAMAPFMKHEKLRVLGVTSKDATPLAPGQPPISQAVPGYAFPGWYGVVVPLKTPKAIVDRLNREFTRTVNDPETRDRLIKVGVEPAANSPAEFRAFLVSESLRMKKVMKEAGVSVK